MQYLIFCIVSLSLVYVAQASLGDRIPFFANCRYRCIKENCTADGLEIQAHAVDYYQQSIFDKIFLWSCGDECEYSCMWKTVMATIELERPVPQFFGKWPFVRFMGIQEPASTLFSMANFVAHLWALRAFRKEVRPDSPFFKLWHVFALVNLNGWFWSAVFHTRDLPLTELLDYAFANSIVLTMFYCMILRLSNLKSLAWNILISLGFLIYFISYFSTMALGRIKYSYNMKINVLIGFVTGIFWLIWCFLQREKRPYSKLMVKFYCLFIMATALELLDFPPIFWTFDSHALWHLSTIGLVPIVYRFAIEDCKALRAEKYRKEV